MKRRELLKGAGALVALASSSGTALGSVFRSGTEKLIPPGQYVSITPKIAGGPGYLSMWFKPAHGEDWKKLSAPVHDGIEYKIHSDEMQGIRIECETAGHDIEYKIIGGDDRCISDEEFAELQAKLGE